MASISETGYTFNRETIHTRIANTMSGVTAATTDNKSVTAILFSFALYPNLVQKSEKIASLRNNLHYLRCILLVRGVVVVLAEILVMLPQKC